DAAGDLEGLLAEAARFKAAPEDNTEELPLRGKALAMIFEKASTRSRISFEVAMAHLGGTALYLNRQDLQLGRGETLEDTARVLSRFVDGIVYRAYRHEDVIRLARAATVPVVNGLDDLEHPAQILADLFTIREALGEPRGRKLAYVGDGNNVCNSLILGCALTSMNVAVATPSGYEPDADTLALAERTAADRDAWVKLVRDPVEAVSGADVVYTDVWVSMGMEEEQEARERDFLAYQVNEGLVKQARPEARVMHPLPAHRGLEITDAVLDGPASIVWDQAENRLHLQKALLAHLLGSH
ncbi:MAG: ornithine carbamoyltransferase, partial [Thermoplasmata archaeon]|nr:ornithine carbamoyltransferase [Thermoplasmata archaeon]